MESSHLFADDAGWRWDGRIALGTWYSHGKQRVSVVQQLDLVMPFVVSGCYSPVEKQSTMFSWPATRNMQLRPLPFSAGPIFVLIFWGACATWILPEVIAWRVKRSTTLSPTRALINPLVLPALALHYGGPTWKFVRWLRRLLDTRHSTSGTRDYWWPRVRSRLNAALINARCVKACGKLPSASPCELVCSA